MDLELKNKRCLVTGALGGFGRALVNRFHAEGAEVIATGTRPEAEVRSKLEAFRPVPAYRQLDYTDAEAIERAVAETDPAIVIANAGLTHPAPLHATRLEDWRKLLEVNLTGNFLLGKAAANRMAERGGGSILFIGSWAQTVPQKNIGGYGPSKAGMKMMALCLAKELAHRRVRINVISPGIIDTGMAARQMAGQAERRERAERVTLCGRLGTAEEVADACAFLVSPRADFIYGADLLIDGGASLGV